MMATVMTSKREKDLVEQLNGALGLAVVEGIHLLDYADLWNLHELVDPRQTFARLHQRWRCPTLPGHVEQTLWQQAAERAPETMVTLAIPSELENAIMGIEYVRLLQQWQRTANPGCLSCGSVRGAADIFDLIAQQIRERSEAENRFRSDHLFPIGIRKGSDGEMLCYYHS